MILPAAQAVRWAAGFSFPVFLLYLLNVRIDHTAHSPHRPVRYTGCRADVCLQQRIIPNILQEVVLLLKF